MFHSIIITGSKKKNRRKKALAIRQKYAIFPSLINDPDTYLIKPLPKKSVGIKDIRQIQKWLQKKPYQAAKKVVIINQAQNITLPAQNAFLKTLEEPPQNSLIILTVANLNLLLPTIVSRCQIIRLHPPLKQKIPLSSSSSLVSLSTGEKINLARQEGKNQFLTQKWLNQQKKTYRQQLEKGYFLSAKILKNLDQGEKMLKANVNPRLVIEWILLNS